MHAYLRKLKLVLRCWSPLGCAALGLAEGSGEPSFSEELG